MKGKKAATKWAADIFYDESCRLTIGQGCIIRTFLNITIASFTRGILFNWDNKGEQSQWKQFPHSCFSSAVSRYTALGKHSILSIGNSSCVGGHRYFATAPVLSSSHQWLYSADRTRRAFNIHAAAVLYYSHCPGQVSCGWSTRLCILQCMFSASALTKDLFFPDKHPHLNLSTFYI